MFETYLRSLPTLFCYSLDEEETLNEDEQAFYRACWESEFLPVARKLIKVLHNLETAWNHQIYDFIELSVFPMFPEYAKYTELQEKAWKSPQEAC